MLVKKRLCIPYRIVPDRGSAATLHFLHPEGPELLYWTNKVWQEEWLWLKIRRSGSHGVTVNGAALLFRATAGLSLVRCVQGAEDREALAQINEPGSTLSFLGS